MVTVVQSVFGLEKQIIELGREGKQEEAIQLLENSYIPTMQSTIDFMDDLCQKIGEDKNESVCLIEAVISFKNFKIPRKEVLIFEKSPR